jgi:lysophospholipase L1-like esterase
MRLLGLFMAREKSVLCFGDSNTWGYVPLTAGRLLRAERWPGILQKSLGESYYVIEEGLNGRATVFDEPFRDGRNARTSLLAVLESHAPLDLLIIMLGTNDLKHHLNVSAHESARGISALLKIATNSASSFDKGSPKILVIAPPRFGNLSELMAHHFEGAVARSSELPAQYEQSCALFGCSFLDCNQVTTVAGDGIHLDVHGHHKLAMALVPVVKDLIGDLV